jgi:glycosyltransferase involved in cell wall biosynthesis
MYPSVAGRNWIRRTGKPLIIHPHGMLDPWAVRHHRWKKLLAGCVYEKPHLRQAACLRAMSVAEARGFRQYGLDNPVCVIPNGVDVPEHPSLLPPPWTGRIAPGRRVLLYLGRIHPKKGLANFLHAWKEVHRQDPKAGAEWAAAIAGWDQNGHEAELREYARDLGIEQDVAFVGPQFCERKAASFSHADAFILPSFSEGQPMAVLEAWAYQLPVVMTPACNLPEGFKAEAAVQVNPEPRDIARGLRELFDREDQQRREMGRRGKELVAQLFSWQAIGMQTLAMNRWVLGGGPAPACLWIDS